MRPASDECLQSLKPELATGRVVEQLAGLFGRAAACGVEGVLVPSVPRLFLAAVVPVGPDTQHGQHGESVLIGGIQNGIPRLQHPRVNLTGSFVWQKEREMDAHEALARGCGVAEVLLIRFRVHARRIASEHEH